MDEVLGQRHSINPPVLIASIPEDRPGPSSAVGGQGAAGNNDEDERERQQQPRRQKRKRSRDDEFMDLIREDMRLQREIDDRRAQESKERSGRLFSLLEKLINK